MNKTNEKNKKNEKQQNFKFTYKGLKKETKVSFYLDNVKMKI